MDLDEPLILKKQRQRGISFRSKAEAVTGLEINQIADKLIS